MKISYYPDTDTLYIRLKEGIPVESEEFSTDMVKDLDQDGAVIGIEIEHASKRVELSAFNLEHLPKSA
jgi:uncharacterized protein YuzE